MLKQKVLSLPSNPGRSAKPTNVRWKSFTLSKIRRCAKIPSTNTATQYKADGFWSSTLTLTLNGVNGSFCVYFSPNGSVPSTSSNFVDVALNVDSTCRFA